MKKISIIGAGIGGLTTALFLKSDGFEIKVFESASEIKPVGAGIIMANNAMQIYKKIGIDKKIQTLGNKVTHVNITHSDLKIISAVSLDIFEKKYGVYNLAIHRADLQNTLAETLGFEHINLNKRLNQVHQDESIKLQFEDSSIENTDILIGADGINSIVRKELSVNTNIRDTKQLCWRGIAEMELPDQYANTAIEAWGKGKRFGFVKISESKVYWFAVINENLNTSEDLTKLFSEFHFLVLNIISKTPKEKIHFSRIIDLKPFSGWHKNNICLLGDAAHATTPNLGQGACQAVEDAYALSKSIHKSLSIEKAFENYEKIRIKKAHQVVNTSWVLGKISHFENPLLSRLRNWFFSSLSEKANHKQMEKIFDISYLK